MKLKLPEKLKPYEGVIYFVVILLVSHFLWKFTVTGDESGDLVTFFGLNISQPFIFMSRHTAGIVHSILNFLGYHTTLSSGNIIRHDQSLNAVQIVWACTALKQAYIFFCIIAFYRGPWQHKLWYIPLGLIGVYVFNIFRISFITAIVDQHPQSFDLWHEHILKYAFYGMIFILWVIWEEKFCTKNPVKDTGSSL